LIKVRVRNLVFGSDVNDSSTHVGFDALRNHRHVRGAVLNFWSEYDINQLPQNVGKYLPVSTEIYDRSLGIRTLLLVVLHKEACRVFGFRLRQAGKEKCVYGYTRICFVSFAMNSRMFVCFWRDSPH